MGRVIVISSGKGGVGKTTVASNLGIILAKKNKRVCLVDGDFGLNNLDIALELENRVVYDVMDVLKGNCRLSQGLIKDPVLSNLYLLASIKQDATRMISRSDFSGIIADLAEVFDYVLIDSPAGIEFSFERAIAPAGEIVVVVTPSIASLRDARKTIDKANASGILSVGIVVNRVKKNLIKKGEMLNSKDIQMVLGEPVIGEIPESDSLVVGHNLKTIFDSNPEIFKAFNELSISIDCDTSFECKKRRRLSIFGSK